MIYRNFYRLALLFVGTGDDCAGVEGIGVEGRPPLPGRETPPTEVGTRLKPGFSLLCGGRITGPGLVSINGGLTGGL